MQSRSTSWMSKLGEIAQDAVDLQQALLLAMIELGQLHRPVFAQQRSLLVDDRLHAADRFVESRLRIDLETRRRARISRH